MSMLLSHRDRALIVRVRQEALYYPGHCLRESSRRLQLASHTGPRLTLQAAAVLQKSIRDVDPCRQSWRRPSCDCTRSGPHLPLWQGHISPWRDRLIMMRRGRGSGHSRGRERIPGYAEKRVVLAKNMIQSFGERASDVARRQIELGTAQVAISSDSILDAIEYQNVSADGTRR